MPTRSPSGGTGSGDRFNAGEVDVYGLEASFSLDAAGRSQVFSVPIRMTYTFTQGEFQNSFESDFDPWGDVVAGDELPYLPEHQIGLGLGFLYSGWSIFADANFVDEMRAFPGQGDIPDGEGTDSRTIIDLSLRREIGFGVGLFAQVKNLTDEIYVAATRPAGLRPGLDRQFLAGITFNY